MVISIFTQNHLLWKFLFAYINQEFLNMNCNKLQSYFSQSWILPSQSAAVKVISLANLIKSLYLQCLHNSKWISPKDTAILKDVTMATSSLSCHLKASVFIFVTLGYPHFIMLYFFFCIKQLSIIFKENVPARRFGIKLMNFSALQGLPFSPVTF